MTRLAPMTRRSIMTAANLSLLGSAGIAALARAPSLGSGLLADAKLGSYRPMSEIVGFGIRKEANGLTASSDDVLMYREAAGWMKARSEMGVTRQLTLAATYNGSMASQPFVKVPAIGFSARGQIDRTEFGLDFLSGQGLSDNVDILIETELLKQNG